MNLRSKISLAAIAAVSTLTALASAQQECPESSFGDRGLPDAPLASEQNPLSCQFNGVVGNAFAIIDASGTRVAVDMIGEGASFADSHGYTADGDRIAFCQAIDTDPDAGDLDVEDNPAQCVAAVRQDLNIAFNEGE